MLDVLRIYSWYKSVKVWSISETVYFLKTLYISQLEQLAAEFWIILQSDFFLLLSGVVFYVFSELAGFRVYFRFLRRSFQLELGDVGKCLHSPCLG